MTGQLKLWPMVRSAAVAGSRVLQRICLGVGGGVDAVQLGVGAADGQ
jgi:hypothetical protein